MLDEEKIKLMTRMASYENTEGKQNKAVASYFRSDFMALQTIKSVIHGSIAYVLIVAVYLFYDIENFMQNIYKIDLIAYGKTLLIWYLLFVAVYSIISYGIYARRYNIARKSLKCYYNNLKKLTNYYNSQDGQ